MSPPLAPRRVAKGESDPVALPCGGLERCSETPAWILLFYVYHQFPSNRSPEWLGEDLSRLLAPFPSITGKFRISREGINVTCAGRSTEIENWLSAWVREDGDPWGEMWTAVALADPQSTEHGEFCQKWQWTKRRRDFFKPMAGCIHAFPNLSIRATEEVTPLAVPKWSPITLRWNGRPSDSRVRALEPAEWHQLLQKLGGEGGASSETVLIDARNAYESRAGHFAGAVLPPIRRFSSLPDWFRRKWPELHHQAAEEPDSSSKTATVAMYCTGGVRCEKLSSWVVENLEGVKEVYTLNGGIHAYLQWLADQQNPHEEQQAGHAPPDPASPPVESLDSTSHSFFRGAIYVFDARTTVTLDDFLSQPNPTSSHQPDLHGAIMRCRLCTQPTSRYGKCVSVGCHLVVPSCGACLETSVDMLTCCDDCRDMNERIKPALPLENVGELVGETNEAMDGANESKGDLSRSSPQEWTSAALVQRRGFLCACERARRAAWHEPINHIRRVRE